MKDIEAIIKGISQKDWEETMRESGMVNLPLTQDQLALMRVTFELAYAAAQRSTIDIMREIYYHDEFLFEEFFTINQDILN